MAPETSAQEAQGHTSFATDLWRTHALPSKRRRACLPRLLSLQIDDCLAQPGVLRLQLGTDSLVCGHGAHPSGVGDERSRETERKPDATQGRRERDNGVEWVTMLVKNSKAEGWRHETVEIGQQHGTD